MTAIIARAPPERARANGLRTGLPCRDHTNEPRGRRVIFVTGLQLTALLQM
jgi:hypothetical protein